MKKGQISNILRQLQLIYIVDWIRFYILKFKNYNKNKKFGAKHPDVILPPDYLMYESFSIDYDQYYNGGRRMAVWVAEHLRKHTSLANQAILDWGCGPGRIIRHMPEVIGNNCTFYGTDYNSKSIAWCKANIPNVGFNCNPLKAQLPYKDNTIDAIYGISILTHLSEQMHTDWINELQRVLKPEGIILLSTHGDNYKVKLEQTELENYNKGLLVVRGTVKEGHRTYCAFQPKPFMQKLFRDVDILEHIELSSDTKDWVPQDLWIIKKRS
ncbi:class I SAM-dependent methyltransferase [Winogradskyella sp. DF17]|uniref:Class I SAM-dependent methyltransferase n=1 Tax=Winogradskyella pelagia TaxID=2819984 RepID=A0ABS3T3K3_9FLAO|nr:class I SAM-dependent methyltransferase [Winogradskyella sp. DF17]MBO3116456.1 class I SAM-dependent methyltransferase [Winogradskyella sp. DF17]